MSVFSPGKLSSSFKNEKETISSNFITLRSNVLNLEDCNKWIKEFGELTITKWNSRTSKLPEERFVCWSSEVVQNMEIRHFVLLETDQQYIMSNSHTTYVQRWM